MVSLLIHFDLVVYFTLLPAVSWGSIVFFIMNTSESSTTLPQNGLNQPDEAYTPFQIVEWFDIPRPTLFRWEANGEIDKTEHNTRGERIYRAKHLRSIAKRAKQQIANDLRMIVRRSADQPMPSKDIAERLYKIKFFSGENRETALQELQGAALSMGLSDSTIRNLFDYAMAQPQGNLVRQKIMKIIISNESRSQV